MPSSTEHEQDSCSFQPCCSLIDQTVPSSTREDTVVANATTKKVNEIDTKHFQNVMSVGMANEISKKYTNKCVDCSRHNGIKGAMTKCGPKIGLVYTSSLAIGTLDSVVSW